MVWPPAISSSAAQCGVSAADWERLAVAIARSAPTTISTLSRLKVQGSLSEAGEHQGALQIILETLETLTHWNKLKQCQDYSQKSICFQYVSLWLSLWSKVRRLLSFFYHFCIRLVRSNSPSNTCNKGTTITSENWAGSVSLPRSRQGVQLALSSALGWLAWNILGQNSWIMIFTM